MATDKKNALNSQRKNLLPTIAWWFRQMSTGSLRWISRNGRETTTSFGDFQTRSCEIFKSCVPVRRMLQNSQMHRHYNIWINSLTLLNPERKHSKCIIIVHKHCRTLNLLQWDPHCNQIYLFHKVYRSELGYRLHVKLTEFKHSALGTSNNHPLQWHPLIISTQNTSHLTSLHTFPFHTMCHIHMCQLYIATTSGATFS